MKRCDHLPIQLPCRPFDGGEFELRILSGHTCRHTDGLCGRKPDAAREELHGSSRTIIDECIDEIRTLPRGSRATLLGNACVHQRGCKRDFAPVSSDLFEQPILVALVCHSHSDGFNSIERLPNQLDCLPQSHGMCGGRRD